MTQTQTRCIIVLGIPRSGTSAVAGMLHKGGISCGEVFHTAEGIPEYAHFEDERLFEIMNLFRRGKSTAVEHARQYVRWRAEHSARGLWAMKDPRMCNHWRQWLKVLTDENVDYRVVFVNRPIHQCVMGEVSRRASNPDAVEPVYVNYYMNLLECRAECTAEKKLDILYRDLLADPKFWAKKILTFSTRGVIKVTGEEITAASTHVKCYRQ
jgi:hypothetical protein